MMHGVAGMLPGEWRKPRIQPPAGVLLLHLRALVYCFASELLPKHRVCARHGWLQSGACPDRLVLQQQALIGVGSKCCMHCGALQNRQQGPLHGCKTRLISRGNFTNLDNPYGTTFSCYRVACA